MRNWLPCGGGDGGGVVTTFPDDSCRHFDSACSFRPALGLRGWHHSSHRPASRCRIHLSYDSLTTTSPTGWGDLTDAGDALEAATARHRESDPGSRLAHLPGPEARAPLWFSPEPDQ